MERPLIWFWQAMFEGAIAIGAPVGERAGCLRRDHGRPDSVHSPDHSTSRAIVILARSVADGVTRFGFLQKDSYQQYALQEESYHLGTDKKMKNVYVHMLRPQIQPASFATVPLLFKIAERNAHGKRIALCHAPNRSYGWACSR